MQSNLNSSNTDNSCTMANSNISESLRNSSASSRKQIFREIFLFNHEIVCCVYSLELPNPGNSNEYIQHIIIVKEIKTKNPKLLLFASWSDTMINPQWL